MIDITVSKVYYSWQLTLPWRVLSGIKGRDLCNGQKYYLCVSSEYSVAILKPSIKDVLILGDY